jgi:hypothetical protein
MNDRQRRMPYIALGTILVATLLYIAVRLMKG